MRASRWCFFHTALVFIFRKGENSASVPNLPVCFVKWFFAAHGGMERGEVF
ncbi:hypothetical protein [Bartonella raoultii]|uniref:hypothetical protein n=1 Tax=Bartonella raoultii TaxID=1457020 RepID=UPI001ABB9502|nr:hypothetical protein [Bartonella raoultii]